MYDYVMKELHSSLNDNLINFDVYINIHVTIACEYNIYYLRIIVFYNFIEINIKHSVDLRAPLRAIFTVSVVLYGYI